MEAVLHIYGCDHMQRAVTHWFQSIITGPCKTVYDDTLATVHLKRLRAQCRSLTRRAGIGRSLCQDHPQQKRALTPLRLKRESAVPQSVVVLSFRVVCSVCPMDPIRRTGTHARETRGQVISRCQACCAGFQGCPSARLFVSCLNLRVVNGWPKPPPWRAAAKAGTFPRHILAVGSDPDRLKSALSYACKASGCPIGCATR